MYERNVSISIQSMPQLYINRLQIKMLQYLLDELFDCKVLIMPKTIFSILLQFLYS